MEPLQMNQRFIDVMPDTTRLVLKQMCDEVKDSLPSAERAGLLRRYRHTLAVHGLAKARQLTAHLSAGAAAEQLRQFSRTHADILQGALEGTVAALEAALAAAPCRHPRLTALVSALVRAGDTQCHTPTVLVVAEPGSDVLLDELRTALGELPWTRLVHLAPDESDERVRAALKQHSVAVVAGAGPAWSLAPFSLVVPLLTGAAASLLERCRRAGVASLALPVRLDWTAVQRHAPSSRGQGLGPVGEEVSRHRSAPPGQGLGPAAHRWHLRRLEVLSGHTVTVHTRHYRGVLGPAAADRSWPDLVLAADTCLMVRPLVELAMPAAADRLAAHVRALREQSALCWLLVLRSFRRVTESRQRGADLSIGFQSEPANERREETALARLRSLLAPACQLPEYTVRMVYADPDSAIHIILDILLAPAGHR
ncbi:uncharacterized protein LOC119103014 [Pollicipes pollicipes]|uniref:uncharacterized protein LOC119103014 n=1 Tax=Pollicipes pollicipes TaxID=41117 RepID=UPI0018851B65|nr:uncharacterized protein LOC119103014 [Pollicipes pollicipes]